FAPLTAQQDLRPFVALTQQMLDAQAVEVVVLTEEQVEVHDAESTYTLTATLQEDGTKRPPDAYVRARPGLSSHLAVIGARVEIGDVPLVREDGSKRWLRYTRNPIQDRDGELKAFVVVARDITADLETEQLKADFVATVSHELRTPLTPLKGFLSALLQGTVEDTPEAREEYYKIMLNQASRLERLITDLLEVSRIESGKPVVDARPVELSTL